MSLFVPGGPLLRIDAMRNLGVIPYLLNASLNCVNRIGAS
ncbi:unnamed protein product [Rhodiola kirilowii]